MHGQNRAEYKARMRDEATAKKLAQKAMQWNALSTELLKRRRHHQSQVKALLATPPPPPPPPSTSSTEDGEEMVCVEELRKTAVETLSLTRKMLSIDPDPLHLWNHRRELLSFLTDDTSSPDDFISQEQSMTTTSLQRNPKAYGPWFHRKWSVRHWLRLRFASSRTDVEVNMQESLGRCTEILKMELEQCSGFLNLDQRNFHCWSYRRFVVAALASVCLKGELGGGAGEGSVEEDVPVWAKEEELDGSWMWSRPSDGTAAVEEEGTTRGTATPLIGAQIKNISIGATSSTTTTTSSSIATSTTLNPKLKELLEAEWDFTTDKINQNFSNGSAFHYRSKLLTMLHPTTTTETEEEKSILDRFLEELELISNAIYTEPDDQTSWWYLQFILSWANRNNRTRQDEDIKVQFREILMEQFESIRELVETEDGQCKWGLLGMYMISTLLKDLEENEEEEDDDSLDWGQEACGCLEALITLDPDRRVRYELLMNS